MGTTFACLPTQIPKGIKPKETKVNNLKRLLVIRIENSEVLNTA